MKKHLKNLFAFTLCAAVLTTGFAFTAKAEPAVTKPVTEPLCVYGTASVTGKNRVMLTHTKGETAYPEMALQISEQTRILDAVTGMPVPVDQLGEGETVYAYISPVMTLSLPPITNATLILCNIPADYNVPSYEKVDTLIRENGISTLYTTSGKSYKLTSDTVFFPYLTRQIVSEADLTPGRTCLIWGQEKIMIFPPDPQDSAENPSHATGAEGWVLEDQTWYYYTGGNKHFGWLKDKGNWYYLNPQTGAMATGFLTIDGKTYYLQDNGAMLTTPRIFAPDSTGTLSIQP